MIMTLPGEVLKPWKDLLCDNKIEFEIKGKEGPKPYLVAKVEKNDEEGHHWMELIIYDYGNGMDVWTDLRGSMVSMYGVDPNKAIDRFKADKLLHFS